MLAEVVGTDWALGSFSILLLVVSIGVMIFLPKLRKLD
jgi:hypothetical protein